MSANGQVEAEAILVRLNLISGVRVLEGETSNNEIEHGPYIVVLFGDPTPTFDGRAVAVGEEEQPHVMLTSIMAVAASAKSCRAIGAAVKDQLLGWVPNSPHSGPMVSVARGAMYPILDSYSRPTRWERMSHFECDINL